VAKFKIGDRVSFDYKGQVKTGNKKEKRIKRQSSRLGAGTVI